MKTLLQLNTSLYSDAGESTKLANTFVDRWLHEHPNGRVIKRDLAAEPVPHLDAERFRAFAAKPGARTPEQESAVAYSDALIAELREADVIVLGLPLYNFSIPSTLKAYFDHVARAGVTFKYTANGAVGFLTGKKIYVFATRGGVYGGDARETQTAYVRQFLGFLGLDDIEFVYAEGLALDDATRQTSLGRARVRAAELASTSWPIAA